MLPAWTILQLRDVLSDRVEATPGSGRALVGGHATPPIELTHTVGDIDNANRSGSRAATGPSARWPVSAGRDPRTGAGLGALLRGRAGRAVPGRACRWPAARALGSTSSCRQANMIAT